MPFGATLAGNGASFRLWAPAAGTVELELEAAVLPMEARRGGWFEATVDGVRPGARYRYRIDRQASVPDPASRWQPEDVHGASSVLDPRAYDWRHGDWRGRPWHEAVLYELHVGTFTPEGTFAAAIGRLPELVALGVTAIELMPVADFPGRRNWGYDGVLPYAPDSAYGTPDDLKRLVDEAHGRGLMMLLDVVYNHFGPDGNYLQAYAPQFFTDRYRTPWGDAIDFSRREVRDYFIHNALYWLQEYRFDGLRLDAVHAIIDPTAPDILEELADTVRRECDGDRHVHLVLENGSNAAHYLRRREDGLPRHYTAQWNDDIHHAFHVIATGESAGYYADYAARPLDHLVRCLAEGFAWQGEPFECLDGERRGQPSAHLPPAAFVAFLQNHDQTGNRAFGERLATLAEPAVLQALVCILLLAPAPPLLFMGEEWGAPEPFLFFCDFDDALADSVREGRRREFARFPEFGDAAARARIPDPNAEATYRQSQLDWGRAASAPHMEWLALYRKLLQLRQREVVPRLAGLHRNTARVHRYGRGGCHATWELGDGSTLALFANLAAEASHELPPPPGEGLLHATGTAGPDGLGPWSAAWYLT